MIRKKLRVTLPKWKPEPEPLPRMCMVCGQMREHFRFFEHDHPSVCILCIHGNGRWARFAFTSGPDWQRPDGGLLDTGIMNSAMAVIRKIEETARG